jgi:hypothetical protein
VKFAVLRSQCSANRWWARANEKDEGKEANLNISENRKKLKHIQWIRIQMGSLSATECRSGYSKEKGKYSEAMEGKNMQISQIHPIARRQKEKRSDRATHRQSPIRKEAFHRKISYENSLQIFFLMLRQRPIAFR